MHNSAQPRPSQYSWVCCLGICTLPVLLFTHLQSMHTLVLPNTLGSVAWVFARPTRNSLFSTTAFLFFPWYGTTGKKKDNDFVPLSEWVSSTKRDIWRAIGLCVDPPTTPLGHSIAHIQTITHECKCHCVVHCRSWFFYTPTFAIPNDQC